MRTLVKNIWVKRVLFAVVTLVWGSAAGMGFHLLLDYQFDAGEEGLPPVTWPMESALPRSSGTPALIVFAHPKCPCTRASLVELSRLMAHIKDRVSLSIVFYRPDGKDESWVRQSVLWGMAESSGADRLMIMGGAAEIERFKPRTSGQVYLYDGAGELQYSGGITSSRGHEGDNLGRAAIHDFVLSGKVIATKFHVFGCSLTGRKRGDATADKRVNPIKGWGYGS